MSSSGEHNTQDQKESCEHDARPSTDLVDEKAKEEHAEDLTDEIGVGQSGLDDAGHAVFVEVGEQWFHVAGMILLVWRRA